jgi:hypothetical protein
MGMRGTEKNHKSEEGDLAPVRKGRVEEAESNTETEEGVKMAKPFVRVKKRRHTNKRMRESKIRQETTEDRRGLVGEEGELTCEVGRTAHLQDRAVRQSEGRDG